MVGSSFSCSYLQGYSSSVVSHDEVVQNQAQNTWRSTYLSDFAGIGLGVGESLAALLISIEDKTNIGRAHSIVGKRISLQLIAFDKG